PARADGEVYSAADAKALLAKEKLKTQFVRDRRFPAPGAIPDSGPGLITQTRPVIQGFRTLVTPTPANPKHALSNAMLPELEIVIQIYPDSAGTALKMTAIDGNAPAEKFAGAA